MTLKAFTFGAVILTAISAVAQDRVLEMVPQDKAAPQLKVRVPIEGKIVAGAPYSAEVVTEMIQVLADGNRIVQRTTGRVYRDSQGRMRREEDAEPGHVAYIAITDPVAGASYSLEPASRIAYKTPADVGFAITAKMKAVSPIDPGAVELRRQLEAEIARSFEAEAQHAEQLAKTPHVSATLAPAPHDAWDEKVEKLPARNIEGVMAEGTRVTRTIPAGAIGNEQPIVSMTEQWRSPDLQVLVLTRTSDPRTGESTYRLQNIVRGEQNRTWFDVPADYTVKESGIRKLAPAMK